MLHCPLIPCYSQHIAVNLCRINILCHSVISRLKSGDSVDLLPILIGLGEVIIVDCSAESTWSRYDKLSSSRSIVS